MLVSLCDYIQICLQVPITIEAELISRKELNLLVWPKLLSSINNPFFD